MNPTITEKDLESIFSGKYNREKFSASKGILRYVLVFVAVTLFIYVIINFNSLKNNFNFWYDTEFATSTDPTGQNNIIIPGAGNLSAGQRTPNFPDLEDNWLEISTIRIKAPITWGVANTPEAVATGLSNGLIQLDQTAFPGEVGNVFITGHSSNYPWAKGSYNQVFSLLNKLVEGDKVQLKYKNINYLYEVSNIKTVGPNEISVLRSDQRSILTLMTCTPVGTSLNRLIVTAKQIYPDPAANKTAEHNLYKDGQTVLPKVR